MCCIGCVHRRRSGALQVITILSFIVYIMHDSNVAYNDTIIAVASPREGGSDHFYVEDPSRD